MTGVPFESSMGPENDGAMYFATGTHIAQWLSTTPIDPDGRELTKYNVGASQIADLDNREVEQWSYKPKNEKGGWDDYTSMQEKIEAYIDLVEEWCQGPNERSRVIIIGVGGTGSYVLDFVGKEPIARIELFDGDRIEERNRVRAPGGIQDDAIEKKQEKSTYWASQAAYREVIGHGRRFTAEDCQQLDPETTWVFVCLDGEEEKKEIVRELRNRGIKGVDCGIHISQGSAGLVGGVRVTDLLSRQMEEVLRQPGNETDDYLNNLQSGELNALCAAIAVARWKQARKIYACLDDPQEVEYSLEDWSIVEQ